MKRFISALLCVCLLLSLAACAKGEGGAAEPENKFRVGYSKVNINPAMGTALYAYYSGRVIEEVLDYIYVTCVAITDEKDNTVLMYSVDVINVELPVLESLREAITAQVDIPAENIFFTATHTHTAPHATTLGSLLSDCAVTAAKEALEDRKPAEMYFGTAYTEGISFVRSYTKNDGTVVGVNHGIYDDVSELTGHTHDVDNEMRVLQFKREGGKDVVLANWQCHPILLGHKNSLSADIVGMMRMYMEQEDYLFAYYQGGAGNVNPTSDIRSEEVNIDRNYKYTGEQMANAAKRALKNMTQVPTGEIEVITDVHIAKANMDGLDHLNEAAMVVAYFDGKNYKETERYAISLGVGLYSIYHAWDLRERAGNDLGDKTMYVYALRIGDEFAWSTLPGECFDNTVKGIRDNSPFTYNFATAYTNGHDGYVPSEEAWEHGSYEVDVTRVERGTAEALQAKAIALLKQLYENK